MRRAGVGDSDGVMLMKISARGRMRVHFSLVSIRKGNLASATCNERSLRGAASQNINVRRRRHRCVIASVRRQYRQ